VKFAWGGVKEGGGDDGRCGDMRGEGGRKRDARCLEGEPEQVVHEL
jgi:hypothetical protein